MKLESTTKTFEFSGKAEDLVASLQQKGFTIKPSHLRGVHNIYGSGEHLSIGAINEGSRQVEIYSLVVADATERKLVSKLRTFVRNY